MIMTKNGAIYNELNKSIIESIISSVKSPFCVVSRELTYTNPGSDDEISEYVDDISSDEVDKGSIKVVEYLNSIGEYELIDRYNEFLTSIGFTPKGIEVTKITLRQTKLILNKKGLLNRVSEFIDSIPDETLKASAKIEWEYANEVDINNPLISVLKQGLSLSDENVKDMFKEASRL
ncbi:hypothetical protein V2I29_03185 [Campylobacter sp. CX2-8023-23]|uniref:Uncharacterized protein n=1 Tax=Campylobacter porcelli TaxID=1660073 RepID=A0ABU7M4H1_9BACT|nr:hypothetical protein [Campylobacter sp. CX2-8023-23]MEE3744612.1 hypothetical protein [Campylobacter sp. CX2-4855-23]MEE3776468.1 hypothetical protein [Campylobacter sp. CX2-4080-23]